MKWSYVIMDFKPIDMFSLTEGVKPSNGFFPAFESANSPLAVLMYDAKPPG